MESQNLKIRRLTYYIAILIATVILMDFMLPGNAATANVIKVKKKLERYYNAAQNSHFSYKVTTDKHSFYVDEDFASQLKPEQQVFYTTSIIFKEVNTYGEQNTSVLNRHSLRIFSGFVLPFLALLFIVIALKNRKRKMSLLISVLQVLLLADLVFLLV